MDFSTRDRFQFGSFYDPYFLRNLSLSPFLFAVERQELLSTFDYTHFEYDLFLRLSDPDLLSHVGTDLTLFFPLILSVMGGEALPLPGPSGSSSSMGNVPGIDSGSEWRSFEEGVLLEPFSPSESSSQGSHSIHSAMPRASRDEAGPSHSHEGMLEKERLCALLERHLHKYSDEAAVMAKYPQLREADFQNLVEKMALNLDVDFLSASEIRELASGPLHPYTRCKSFLKSFLEDLLAE